MMYSTPISAPVLLLFATPQDAVVQLFYEVSLTLLSLFRFPFVAISIGFSVKKQVSHIQNIQEMNTCHESLILLQCELIYDSVTVWLQIEFGVVYSCLEDKMYTARRGRGAFCNGAPLQVSQQQGPLSALPSRQVDHLVVVFSGVQPVFLSPADIQQSIIATEFGSNRDPKVVDKIFTSLRSVLSIPVHG